MKQTFKLLKDGTPKITLYMDEIDLDSYCLEKGIQPDGLFRIEIRKVNESDPVGL